MSAEPQPMATCPHCALRGEGVPLVPTTVWRYAEWYCMECGAKVGWLDAEPTPTTPELETRYGVLQAQWDEHVAPALVVVRGWRKDCKRCAQHDPRDTHADHATAAEREAHDAALVWLEGRRTIQ